MFTQRWFNVDTLHVDKLSEFPAEIWRGVRFGLDGGGGLGGQKSRIYPFYVCSIIGEKVLRQGCKGMGGKFSCICSTEKKVHPSLAPLTKHYKQSRHRGLEASHTFSTVQLLPRLSYGVCTGRGCVEEESLVLCVCGGEDLVIVVIVYYWVVTIAENCFGEEEIGRYKGCQYHCSFSHSAK